MADDVIHVENIDQLKAYAVSLQAYLAKVREIEQELRNRLARLGDTWQDQEYERFRASFQRVSKQIKLFEEAAHKFPARIEDYAQRVRAIHGDSPPT
jgi:uncharacterized protein YukE